MSDIQELISRWRKEQSKRLELVDGMFTDGNKAYQQGYADALNGCAEALEMLATTAQERQ